MRPHIMKRTAVSIVAATGIAAGSLAGATVSTAAPDTSVRQTAVTGEVHHVDSGYHTVGMKAVDAPDISVVKD